MNRLTRQRRATSRDCRPNDTVRRETAVDETTLDRRADLSHLVQFSRLRVWRCWMRFRLAQTKWRKWKWRDSLASNWTNLSYLRYSWNLHAAVGRNIKTVGTPISGNQSRRNVRSDGVTVCVAYRIWRTHLDDSWSSKLIIEHAALAVCGLHA